MPIFGGLLEARRTPGSQALSSAYSRPAAKSDEAAAVAAASATASSSGAGSHLGACSRRWPQAGVAAA